MNIDLMPKFLRVAGHPKLLLARWPFLSMNDCVWDPSFSVPPPTPLHIVGGRRAPQSSNPPDPSRSVVVVIDGFLEMYFFLTQG